MQKSELKGHIAGIDFMRAICALGIIVYHFLGSSRSGIEVMHSFKNGQMGAVYVTIFFAISGFVLYHNYACPGNTGRYYLKRAKAIYPMFYLAYAYFFIDNAITSGDMFSHGQPWCLIFSVLGVDGYAASKFPVYAFIGEWFLGALIILYVMYPLFAGLLKKSTALTAVIMVGLYIWMMLTQYFTQYAIRNIIACALSFVFGMILAKHKDIICDCIPAVIASAAVALILATVKLPMINEYILTQLFGLSLFLPLLFIGNFVMKYDKYGIIKELSVLSYPIFLLQHQIIGRVQSYQNPSSVSGTLFVLFLTTLLIIFCAWCLKTVSDKLMQSIFRKKSPNL